MDSDIAIQVEDLSKKYLIGHTHEVDRNITLRDTLVSGATRLMRMGRSLVKGSPIVAGDDIEEFWALKDVNFTIKRGEVVGVIGRNGAGKSTLLKVLSRITEPSEGRVSIAGRVASLLEVGTGFHPELSGRENIFLNGAILGMSRLEIRRKFDEIVEFSEVARFLDTPVKRYSSGMYVRLAFGVAAHLEPEILIVDEVLAVGDAEFQKKCLGKMKSVANHGRTVLFVSHNMAAARTLCSRGLLLNAGALKLDADIVSAIETYNDRSSNANGQDLIPGLILKSLSVRSNVGIDKNTIVFEISIEVQIKITLSDLSIVIFSSRGERLCVIDLRDKLCLPLNMSSGLVRVSGTAGYISLIEHEFDIGLYISTDRGSGDFLGLSKITPAPPAHYGRRYPSTSLGVVGIMAISASLTY